MEANLDTNALLEYEATTNNAWLRQDGPINPVICTYDLNRFTANIIVDVMRAHPMVIIGESFVKTRSLSLRRNS